MSDLPRDYTMGEVAEAIGMSERWVRQQVARGAVHQRYGHKVRFTAEQVEQLRESHAKAPVKDAGPITTGKKRS